MMSSAGGGGAFTEDVTCNVVLLPAEVRLVLANLSELLGEIPLERVEDEEALKPGKTKTGRRQGFQRINRVSPTTA